jgi:hypothetical protein
MIAMVGSLSLTSCTSSTSLSYFLRLQPMEQASLALISVLFYLYQCEAISSARSRQALEAVTLLGMDHPSLEKPAGQ